MDSLVMILLYSVRDCYYYFVLKVVFQWCNLSKFYCQLEKTFCYTQTFESLFTQSLMLYISKYR